MNIQQLYSIVVIFVGRVERNSITTVDSETACVCYNGGTCVQVTEDVSECICLTGFSGTTCEIDMNDCTYGPCLPNYNCTNNYGSHHCVSMVSEAPPGINTLNEGFLLFLQAGTELSITDAFSNASLTVTTHSNRHEWSPRQFVNTGENFRSHLIDKWSVMDVQKVSLVFFNKAGWEVMTYEFPPDSIDDNMGNVLVKLQQPPNAMARIDGETDIVIESLMEPGNVSLLSYYQSTQPGQFKGQQFLVNTEFRNDFTALQDAALHQATRLDNLMQLFSAESHAIGIKPVHGSDDAIAKYVFDKFGQKMDMLYRGCYPLNTSQHAQLYNVTRVHQCAYICLAHSVLYFGMVSDSQGFSCLCLDDSETVYGMELQNTTCTTRCDDSRPCGLASASRLPSWFEAASVYFLVPTQNYLNRIYLANETKSLRPFISESKSQMDLEGVFINGITVSELPNVDGNIYKIQFSPERCQDVTEWDEYRHINGAIREFSVNQLEVIEPMYISCLNISIDFSVIKYYNVHIRYLTEDFIFAEYAGLYVHWRNITETTSPPPYDTTSTSPCHYEDLMGDSNIISNNNITIKYQDTPVGILQFVDPHTWSVPAVAINKVVANFPSEPEIWVDRVYVKSDQDVVVDIEAQTSQDCTDQDSGSSVIVERNLTFFSTVSANDVYNQKFATSERMACVSYLRIVAYKSQPLQGQDYFNLTIYAYGCPIQPASKEGAQARLSLHKSKCNIVGNHKSRLKYIAGDTTVESCEEEDLLRRADMEELVKVHWQPRSPYTVSTLRSSGPGLLLLDKMHPSVKVDLSPSAILVTQVILFGSVHGVQINLDSPPPIKGFRDTTTNSIAVDLNPHVSTSSIIVQPFGESNGKLLSFTLQIMGCSEIESTTTATNEAFTSAINSTSEGNVTTQSINLTNSTNDTPAPTVEPPVSTSSVNSTSAGDVTTESAISLSPLTQTPAPTVKPNVSMSSASPTSEGGNTTQSAASLNSLTLTSAATAELSHTAEEDTTTVGQNQGPHQQTEIATTNDAICCTNFCSANFTFTKEELDNKIEELIKKLSIPKQAVSSHRRRKTSAEDSRTSAVVVGNVGVAFLVLTGAFIVFLDIDHVIAAYHFLRMGFTTIRG